MQMVFNCGQVVYNRYQVGDYKCETRMNEGRKRNELPVQNTENRGEKNIYLLTFAQLSVISPRGLSLFSDSEMKRAEWLRPFSFGNAIGSRPFSLGSVIGFSSILTMESARDDWLSSILTMESALCDWTRETDDPAPGSDHRDRRRTILWSAKAKYQCCACHTYPALANSGQEMGWKLRDRWEVKEAER